MADKTVPFAISITILFGLLYGAQCGISSFIPCIKQIISAINPLSLAAGPTETVRCLQNNCTNNCLCTSLKEFDVCSQFCNSSLVCPSIVCNTSLECDQTAFPASSVPYLYCNSTKRCQQLVSYAKSEKMVALSRFTQQTYTNEINMLPEMVCRSSALHGACNQSCEFCNSTSCSAGICEINCTKCSHVACGGSSSCKAICNRQCNTTICQSPECSMVCGPGSQCNNIECGIGVINCSLECRSGSFCSLNCGNADRCDHSCALDGLCYTKGPGYVDKHNGQCGLCNCSRDIRNCVQRCQSQNGRCLGLYCDASNRCEQYSKFTDKSFVLFMISTAPMGRQVCYNGSDCWHMLCYGSNCSLICETNATCGHMLCSAENCSFHCKTGAVCDVLTCLPGSERCEYHCEAGATCRMKKCQGKICIGAKTYVKATSSSFGGRQRFKLMNTCLPVWLLLLLIFVLL